MALLPDQTGVKYGRLTIVSDEGRGRPRWVAAECECGSGVKRYDLYRLRYGGASSCGCRQREVVRSRSLTHGMRSMRLHESWRNMRRRCTASFQRDHPSYAGVKHCPEWATFGGFRDHPPHDGTFGPGMVLARTGDVGDYAPENCRWATRAENNREAHVVHFIDGRPAVDVAEERGIKPKTMRARVAKGWPVDLAATWPVGVPRPR